MTSVIIDDVIPRTQLLAAASQTVFNTNWTADVATDVLVYARAAGVVPNDVTQLVSSSNYNVTFIGGSQTVRVTFLVGRTMDDVITIVRDTPAERLNLYINTNFTPSMLNEDFGILTLVDQQAQMYDYVVNPGYNVSATIENIVDTVLPILAANQIWAMNPTRTGIIPYNVPSGGGVAPNDATYLLQVADSELPNAQAMGALTTGFVFNTAITGVQFIRSLAGVTDQTVITNATGAGGNPTVGFALNAKIPGVEGMGVPQGSTGDRPGSPSGTEFRFNTDLLVLEYWDGSNWVQVSESDGVLTAAGTLNQILVNGGITPVDGAVTFALSPTLNLPGTFNIQGTTAVNGIINDDTMATASATNLATALSIKNYIDTIATGFQFVNPVNAASTADFASTYANGAAGVGATLTASVNGAFSLDGQAGVLNNRYLIKNQSTTFQNGIYSLTVVGDGSTAAVLTRSTDYNQPSEIEPGDLVPILAGSVNANSIWLQTATVTTIGTDPITFTALTPSFTNVVTITGIQTITGAKTFTADTTINNLFLTGAAIQHLADLNNQILFGTDTQSFETGGTSRMDISDTGFRLGAANSRVTTILDEDNMASDSATALATQQSIKAYADTKISTINAQKFTASGTYTPTSGMKYCIVEMVGAGGGGGGGATTTGAQSSAGAGGGAAAYAKRLFTAAQVGATAAVTVPNTGGAGGTTGNNAGTTGSNSSIALTGSGTITMTSGGGSGGAGCAASSATIATYALGGSGGSATNADISSAGDSGVNGFALGITVGSIPGKGAGSIWGGGGGCVPTQNGSSVGNVGSGYGAGGAGGSSAQAGVGIAGSAGSPGICYITEYISV